MVMSNLLHGTSEPHIMVSTCRTRVLACPFKSLLAWLTLALPPPQDIKIGQRTFQETEVTNQKTRMDLLKKVVGCSCAVGNELRYPC